MIISMIICLSFVPSLILLRYKLSLTIQFVNNKTYFLLIIKKNSTKQKQIKVIMKHLWMIREENDVYENLI